jgi:hypothetical protein
MKQPWRHRCYSKMVSEAAKLNAELTRLIRLRAWTNDKRTQDVFTQLIKETDERLRQLADATGDRDAC